jgi:cobalt-zinc-cadmium efflux system protein
MTGHEAHHHPNGGHVHDAPALSGKKIFWVTVLNAAITAAEIAGGLLSGSLALLSDAVHNFSDTVAVAMSYVANRSRENPGTPNGPTATNGRRSWPPLSTRPFCSAFWSC